jgi:hypothetical protein
MAVFLLVALGNVEVYALTATVGAVVVTTEPAVQVFEQKQIPNATGDTVMSVNVGPVYNSEGGAGSAAARIDLATGIVRGGAEAYGGSGSNGVGSGSAAASFGANLHEDLIFSWYDGAPAKNIIAKMVIHGICGFSTSEDIVNYHFSVWASGSGSRSLSFGSTTVNDLIDCEGGIRAGNWPPFEVQLVVHNGEVIPYAITVSGTVRALGKSSALLGLFDTIRLSLVVPDGVTYTSTSGVFLTKASIPITRVGLDQTVNAGTVVTLDGSASSDPSGNLLTYTWTQVAGPIVVLNLADPAHPTFTAPNVPLGGETLTFQLVVSTGSQTSAPVTTNVTVKYVNHPPVANAGPTQTVGAGAVVTLDSSASYDPDGDVLSYQWTQTGGPPVTLSSPTAIKPTFTAPPVSSGTVTLSFQLTVRDGALTSTALVSIIDEHVNHPPVANAGLTQTINDTKLVTLDGSASSDPDSDLLTYVWSQLSGTPVTLSNPGASQPTFTAPVVSASGDTLVFQLTVTDPGQLSSTATTTVTVVHQSLACSAAKAKPSVLWPPNHKLIPVKIIGVTDPDNRSVTIQVTQVTSDEPVQGRDEGDMKPDAVIQGQGVLLRAERNGRNNGRVYVVTFTATDSPGGSCQGTVIVTVPHDRHGDDVDDRNAKTSDDGQVNDARQQ